MYKVKNILAEINKIAPLSYAEKNDNVGMLIGDKEQAIDKIIVCLDVTKDVVWEAIEKKVNLIISHHPVIYGGVKCITSETNHIIYDLLKNNISVICAHTNLDIAPGGVNYELFMLLDMAKMRPLKPADNAEGMSLGLVGELRQSKEPSEFVKFIKKQLKAPIVRYVDGEKDIQKVAICGGSGMSLLDYVLKADVDAFVTGDVKHHDFIDAYNNGLTLIDAGHFSTENIIVKLLVEYLRRNFDDISIEIAETGTDKIKHVI